MQNLFLCNSKTIGCQSKLKCSNFTRKIKKTPEKLETESEKKTSGTSVTKITVASFSEFNDGRLKANIPGLKRQTQTSW